jgi:hypothetical protein
LVLSLSKFPPLPGVQALVAAFDFNIDVLLRIMRGGTWMCYFNGLAQFPKLYVVGSIPIARSNPRRFGPASGQWLSGEA